MSNVNEFAFFYKRRGARADSSYRLYGEVIAISGVVVFRREDTYRLVERSSPATPCGDGDPCGTWVAQTGDTLVAPSDAARGAYRTAGPGVQADGVDDVYSSSTVNLMTAAGFLAINCRVDTPGADTGFAAVDWVAGGWDQRTLSPVSGGGGFRWTFQTSDGTVNPGFLESGVLAAGDWHTVSVSWSHGVGQRMWVDGTLVASLATTYAAAKSGGLRLFESYSGRLAATVGDLVWVPTLPSDGEIASVHAWLGGRR